MKSEIITFLAAIAISSPVFADDEAGSAADVSDTTPPGPVRQLGAE